MPPLINFPIDLTRTGVALESIRTELARIANALERLSPELPAADAIRPAGLSDLRRTDLDTVARVKSELETFATNHNVVVDSEAFVRSIIKYEREVASVYGIEAINELPWNKAAGGPLFFESHADPGDQKREAFARKEGGAAVADAESASRTT